MLLMTDERAVDTKNTVLGSLACWNWGNRRAHVRQRLSNFLKELVDKGLVKKILDPAALMLRMGL